MKTILFGLIVSFITIILTRLFLGSQGIYECVLWIMAAVLIACIWIYVYKERIVNWEMLTGNNPKCIEIIGFYLTLLGLILALNGDVLSNTNNLKKSLCRMFEKENIVDFSELFSSESTSVNGVEKSSHVVLALDVSGSVTLESNGNNSRWKIEDSDAENVYKTLMEKVKPYVTTFSGTYNKEIANAMKSIGEKPSKFNLFRLRALQFIMYLDSLNRNVDESKKLNLTVIKFGEGTHVRSLNTNYLAAIPYILEVDSESKNMRSNTNFVNLFNDISGIIFPDSNEKNRQKRPQYVFTFFTDFLHDPLGKNNDGYSIEGQRRKIREKLDEFCRKSNYSTFYFFSSDTILKNDYVRNMDKKVFSVLPLIKGDDDWMNVKPVLDVKMIELGVYPTKECLTLYYTKPFVTGDESNVKLTFKKFPNKSIFNIALKGGNKLPLHDQYVFYTGSNDTIKKIITRSGCLFEAYNDIPLTIQFQGYVNNQIPSRVFELKDLRSGKKYEFDVIFVKDFPFWVKYVLFCTSFIFLIMLIVKIWKSIEENRQKDCKIQDNKETETNLPSENIFIPRNIQGDKLYSKSSTSEMFALLTLIAVTALVMVGLISYL